MKTPNDFQNHNEWLAFVRGSVPIEHVPFVLAQGRTELYREFYKVRGVNFPEHFSSEIERISAMTEPERTVKLEDINDAIFNAMIQLLFTAAKGIDNGNKSSYPIQSGEVIQQLIEHLTTKNAYFALWTYYHDRVSMLEGAPDWRGYVISAAGMTEDSEIEFALLISELGRSLEHYYQRQMTLPKHFYFQIWFLHRTEGPERSSMLRALVQELVEGMEPCAYA